MKEQLLSFIPKNSRTLGMLHDKKFRPDQSPAASAVNDGRVLFEQNSSRFPLVEIIRAPICLMTEGDTALIRNLNKEEGFNLFKRSLPQMPTAAMLFDSFAQLKKGARVVWFAEDTLCANTVGRVLNLDPNEIKPLFSNCSEEIVELINRFVKQKSHSAVKWAFSDLQVAQAIEAAMVEEITNLGWNSKDRKRVVNSTAAIVASTHSLFDLIAEKINGFKQESAVQGPVHLETNPPHWAENPALSTAVRFVKISSENHQKAHRSLVPCLFEGEPIGEFAAFTDDGPQIRRDQRWKLEQWLKQNPFPLSANPIFGHAIGLLEEVVIIRATSDLIKAEQINDVSSAKHQMEIIAEGMDKLLSIINFWK